MNTREEFTLSVGASITGADLLIKGYRYKNGNGPAVYIQGGTHGGEVTFSVFKLLNEFLLQSEEWNGLVTLVPISNPFSWNQRVHYSTIGKFNFYDGKDWNRSFPGNNDGSTSERWASAIFTEAQKHDFVIDLHTSRNSLPFNIISREDLLSVCRDTGLPFTYLASKMKGGMPLPDAIDAISGKGITIECGSHDSMDKENAQKSFEAILNIFRSIGLLNDNKEKNISESVYFTKYDSYFAPESGFVEYVNPLGASIKKGELLYILNTSKNLGEVVNIYAREDCTIMKYQPTHITWIGDEVVMVLNDKDKIKNAG